MEYTNKHDLPELLVQWLMFDEYDYEEGVFSATSIMRPIRASVLMQRHKDELQQDVTDVIASRYGTAIHDSFEKVPLKDCTQEVRMYYELNGFKISGKPDILKLIDKGTRTYQMVDIKSTSTWTVVYGSRDEDHRIQLSIYKWLAEMNAYPMHDIGQIIFIFTDWSKSKARQGNDYPPLRCMIKDVQLMPNEEVEEYILKRLRQIEHLGNNPEEELPRCQREELWQKDDKWAVMKDGRKSALKLFDNEAEALTYWRSKDIAGTHIEHRAGSIARCDYCTARHFCSQYEEHKEAGLIAD